VLRPCANNIGFARCAGVPAGTQQSRVNQVGTVGRANDKDVAAATAANAVQLCQQLQVAHRALNDIEKSFVNHLRKLSAGR